MPVNAKAWLLLCFGLWACGQPSSSKPDVGGGGDVSTSNPDAGDGGGVPTWTPDPIVFSACEGEALAGWECGFLTVPVDYANPVEFLRIRVSRKTALDPARRLGVLLYNPGGAGIGGVQAIPDPYGVLRQAQQRFDFIGFDPRGTGASEPDLKCLTDEEIEEFRVSDGSRDESGAMAIATKLRAGCLRTAGSASRLGSVTSKNAARDMDSIRIALGEEKLNYLGASYGTWLGAVYATLFPSKVRAFVLDAGVSPDYPSGEHLQAQVASITARLETYFFICGSSRCDIARDGRRESAKEAYEAALSLLDRGEANGGRRPLSAADFHDFVVGALNGGGTRFATITSAIRDIVDGRNTRPLLETMDADQGRQPDGTYPDFETTRHVAITCADGLAGWTRESWESDLAAMAAVNPRLGVFDLWRYHACLDWPAAGDRATIDAKDAPPLLVLEGRFDPSTPSEGTRGLVAALGNGSHLFTYPYLGHVSYPRNAVRLRVQEFLEEPDTVAGEPMECSDWVRPAATERDLVFQVVAGSEKAAVRLERRDLGSDAVLETKEIAAGGLSVQEFTVPAGTSDTHVLLHATGEGFRPHRRYLDLHGLGQGLPDPYIFLVSEAEIEAEGTAEGVGITQAPQLGFISATFTDCDGLPPPEFKLRLPGVVVHEAGRPCKPNVANERAAASCGRVRAYNVPPGAHATGVEVGGASFPGPTIVVDAGGLTEVSFTPESD